MSKQHFNYLDVVNQISESGWGAQFESIGDAERDLLSQPAKLAGLASVELLRRLNQIANGLSQHSQPKDASEMYEPTDPCLIPGISCGDVLYGFDEDGLAAYSVLAVDDKGRCICVNHAEWSLDRDDFRPRVASDLFLTKEEAIQDWVESELKYHTPLLARVRTVEEALNSNADLSQFENGLED